MLSSLKALQYPEQGKKERGRKHGLLEFQGERDLSLLLTFHWPNFGGTLKYISRPGSRAEADFGEQLYDLSQLHSSQGAFEED